MSPRIGLVGIALFVALGAFTGGGSLIADPTGQGHGLPLALLEHSPFDSYLVPGLLLFFVIGGSQLAAGVAHLRRLRLAPLMSLGAGVVLVGWTVVQLALVRELHWLQVLFFSLGLGQLALAVRELGHDEPGDCEANAATFLAFPDIALVGLSTDEAEFSHTIATELRAKGHEVLGVNPHAAEAGAEGFVARVTDLPEPPRAVLLMVPPEASLAVVDDCIAAGVTAVWFHKGAGPGSASPEAVAKARDAGMLVITDACPMMYLQPVDWLHRAHRNLAGVTP